MSNEKMREARNNLVRIEKYLSTQPAEYCGYMDNYFSAELSSIEAALSQQPEIEPVPFEVGGHYRTQGGKWVKFVTVHNQGTRHETMADENGVNRYTNRPGDMGRVTGTAHDYSDRRNTPPTYASPQPSAQVEEWRHDSEELEALHMNFDDAGIPRHEDDVELSAWGRTVRYSRCQPSAQVPEGLEEFLKRIGVMLQPNGSLNVWSSRENRWVIARMAGELSDEYAMLTAAPSIAEKR